MMKISIQSWGAVAETKAFGYRCWIMDDMEWVLILLRLSTGCYIRPTSRHKLCLTLNRRCTAEEMAPNGRDSETTIYSPNTNRTRVVYAHAYNSTNTKKQGSRRRLSKEEIVFCIPGHGIGQVFFPPMPSCIYLIGLRSRSRSRSRPMSPLFGQMTTESFDANAAISLGDLCLIIGPRAPEPAPRLIILLNVTPPDSGAFLMYSLPLPAPEVRSLSGCDFFLALAHTFCLMLQHNVLTPLPVI